MDYNSGLLAGMLSNRGIDPGVVALLERNGNSGAFGGGDGGLLTLLFLVLLLGGGGAGFGGGGGYVNAQNSQLLFDAIAGNNAAIQNLATNLNCSCGQIQSAICAVDKEIAVSNGSIISAIQSCCCNLQGKIDSTSCATNLNIERGFNGISNGISNLGYTIQSQFCNQNSLLLEKFNAIEQRELQHENQRLRDRLEDQRVNAQTAILLNAINGGRTVSGTLDTTAETFTGIVGRPA